MDALSEILATMKLHGAMFFRGDFNAPWYTYTREANELAGVLAPGASHLLIYHMLIEGNARARLPRTGEDVILQAGDIVVFPHGDAHELLSVDGTCTEESDEVERKVIARDLSPLKLGGDGPLARFVCGYMACDTLVYRSLLASLPRLMRVNIRQDQSGKWLESAVLHLLEEAASGAPGSQALLAKLSEALFVDTLRRHMATLDGNEVGWLAGARDAIVGKSLAVMHANVHRPWTIAELAREVGASRTALVERFSRFLGIAPMAYLTRWRLQLAARALTTTSKPASQIAAEVGYESEAAFNRAFKREFQLPPVRFRREALTAAERQ